MRLITRKAMLAWSYCSVQLTWWSNLLLAACGSVALMVTLVQKYCNAVGCAKKFIPYVCMHSHCETSYVRPKLLFAYAIGRSGEGGIYQVLATAQRAIAPAYLQSICRTVHTSLQTSQSASTSPGPVRLTFYFAVLSKRRSGGGKP